MAFLSQNCKRRASPKGQLPRRGLLARFARIERRLPDGMRTAASTPWIHPERDRFR